MDPNLDMPTSSPPLPNSSQKRKNILIVLTRLALHCQPKGLDPGQFKLVLDDMVTDLSPFSFFQFERAVAEWRRGENYNFPTSGQLIAIMRRGMERPRERYIALEDRTRHWAFELKPWREILGDGPVSPAVAKALDAMQRTPQWVEGV